MSAPLKWSFSETSAMLFDENLCGFVASLRSTPLAKLQPMIDALYASPALSTLAGTLLKSPLGEIAPVLDALARALAPAPAAPVDLVDVARAILTDVAIGRGHRRGRLDAIEGAIVREAVKSTRGNVSAAARALGMDRKSLERKIRRHKVTT